MATSNSDIAATLDIIHRRGDSFYREFDFGAMSLTGHTAKLHVKKSADSDEVILGSTGVSISGNIVIAQFSAATMNIPARKYHWDLQLTNGSGVVTTYIKGDFTINADVSR